MASPGQALALYESRFSAIKDSAVAYARYLDNHVLGGVTFGPKLRRGANRIVGAWGHTPLAWPLPHELDGRDCWCGRTGCLDCFLSLGGLETEYHNITQTRLGIKAIAAAADASDLVASSVLQVLDDRIGRTTAMIINMFDPDVIFLGGRLAGLDRLYQNVPRKWPGYLLVERNETKLQKANQDAFTLTKGAA
jgi:predicted NBD/HSP70 family sugar kinase